MARTLPASKRRLILAAARRLLVKGSFQDVVLDDVAREADVAKGTLFLHFKNKEELITAAFVDMVDQLGENLAAASGSGLKGKALLAAAVEAVLAHLERYHDVMGQGGAARCPKETLARNLGLVKDILENCSRDGLFPLADADTAALALFGLCRTAVFHRLISGDPRPFTSRTAAVIDMFMYGVKGKR